MRSVITFAIAAICVLGASAYMAVAYKAAAQGSKGVPAFVADPKNSIRLSVHGWGRSELDKILADFSQQYGLPGSGMTVAAQPNETLVITFPNDIEPKLLFFLINYIHYPNGFDLKHRSIAAVAHVVLTPAFGAPDSAFIGKRAIIYVPANDTDYDLVYAQIETDKTYKIPFTDLIWRDTADARLPTAIKGL